MMLRQKEISCSTKDGKWKTNQFWRLLIWMVETYPRLEVKLTHLTCSSTLNQFSFHHRRYYFTRQRQDQGERRICLRRCHWSLDLPVPSDKGSHSKVICTICSKLCLSLYNCGLLHFVGVKLTFSEDIPFLCTFLWQKQLCRLKRKHSFRFIYFLQYVHWIQCRFSMKASLVRCIFQLSLYQCTAVRNGYMMGMLGAIDWKTETD